MTDPRGAVPQVVDIELDRASELRVSYDDGVVCTFPLLPLRLACPCATCRSRREADQLPYGGDSVTADGAELQGNWGISITWSDGHSTGIYPWTHLRSWWDSGLD
ncbi:MAG: DUF971 domain-containing protein [Ilumatobacter sp.]|nr:DUF971 domain-containing protein [Ilumatobacter sp.]